MDANHYTTELVFWNLVPTGEEKTDRTTKALMEIKPRKQVVDASCLYFSGTLRYLAGNAYLVDEAFEPICSVVTS
ncbi:MAG: hypothetical protein FK732_10750 [Asgard group archaeon]|nr:hypothetical protein [Asgard group archaeon]